MSSRFTQGLIGMTGEAFFLLPLFRGALREVGDRRVLDRWRCSEHEVARELLIGVISEPGSALQVGFNSGVAMSFAARRLPTGDPLLHSTHVVDVARVVVVARDAQSTRRKWIA